MPSLVVVAALAIVLTACGAPPAPARGPQGDPLESVPAEELVRRGRVFAARGDHPRALEYYRAAKGRGIPDARVAPLMIDSAVATQRYREALQYAGVLLERDPKNWRLRFLVANLHLGIGEPRPAEEELDRVVELAPDAPEPHYLLAKVLSDQAGRQGEARPLYQRYLALAPEGEHAATARRWLAAHPPESDLPTPPTPPAPATSKDGTP
jgi:tetratricopeptide (TPR) repeat protein